MAERLIMVGMAEIHAVRVPAQFWCVGLGSCVGVCALDPVSGVSGMVNVLLPEAPKGSLDNPGTYADTGVNELIARMALLGATVERIKVAYIGGAQVAKFGSQPSKAAQFGERNVEVVKQEVEKLGLAVVDSATGGNMGRSVVFETNSGVIRVRTVNKGEHNLCSLKEAA